MRKLFSCPMYAPGVILFGWCQVTRLGHQLDGITATLSGQRRTRYEDGRVCRGEEREVYVTQPGQILAAKLL